MTEVVDPEGSGEAMSADASASSGLPRPAAAEWTTPPWTAGELPVAREEWRQVLLEAAYGHDRPGVPALPPPPPPAAPESFRPPAAPADPIAVPRRQYGFGAVRWASGSPTSSVYVAPMLGLVGFAVFLLAFWYSRSPVPPGVDPGHWLSVSYSYVGLPTASDPANAPLYYSPLIFPFLGALVRLTGDPLRAAFLFAEISFALYGLSTLHLARRFLISGPLQVGLVGAALLCGTTLQMLFWGAYPNIVAFVFFNEAMVLLVAFVRSQSWRDSALFYAAAGLVYFTHTLTFAILIGAVGAAFAFLLLYRKLSLRFFFRRANLVGLAGLVAAIGVFSEVTKLLGVPHPGYLSTNPTAYHIDHIGELFLPLARAPSYFPPGAAVVLTPLQGVMLLLAVPVTLFLVLGIVGLKSPRRLDTRLIVAAGWLSGACGVPALGYLAHVDTDYTRFLYFLPLPAALVAALSVERAFQDSLVGPMPSVRPPAPRSLRRLARWSLQPAGAPTAITAVAVGFVLVFLAADVAWPSAQAFETSSTASAHDPPFLAAAAWLDQNPSNGSVLTVSGAARWTEALSHRPAYTVGPVWLLFDRFQMVNTQESYWALTGTDTLTDNHVALCYSGFASPVFREAPLFTAYEDGIAFPVLRVVPNSLTVNATVGNTTQEYSGTGGVVPTFEVVNGTVPVVRIVYDAGVARVMETGYIAGNDSAILTFQVTPTPGVTVHSLSFDVAAAPTSTPVLQTDQVEAVDVSGSTLVWSVTGKLGQLPGTVNVTTFGRFSVPPSAFTTDPRTAPSAFRLTFPDANGSNPFGMTAVLSTPGASNPVGALPPLVDTTTFLAQKGIAFLLWPNVAVYLGEVSYYEATFGFRPVYANSEWIVLQQ